MNETLNRARYRVNTDDWYTPYEIVDSELKHYSEQFYGKTIYCCCDSPNNSNFVYYFLRNFNSLGIKRLIATSLVESKLKRVDMNIFLDMPYNVVFDDTRGMLLDVDRVDGWGAEVFYVPPVVKNLEGDGDFLSQECSRYFDECDIVVTNPPFSLFSELFSLVVARDKKFLLIGNQNALLYKDVFPYVVKNKVWTGYNFGNMEFRVPDDTPPADTRYWQDGQGHAWRSLGNALWITNLDVHKSHELLDLHAKYYENLYPKFDGTDVIRVKRVVDIPYDYDGVMGVPLTFFKYYNPDQFEIVGEANHGSDNEFDLFKPVLFGKNLFKCVLIRKR